MNDRPSPGATPDPSGPPSIGADSVRRIAALARLRIDESEIPGLVEHFTRMLRFMEHLAEADDPELPPWELEARPLGELRPDETRAPGTDGGPLPPEAWQRNAPEVDGPYFTVPRVVG